MTSSTEARGNKYKVVEYCYLSRILVNKQKKKKSLLFISYGPWFTFFLLYTCYQWCAQSCAKCDCSLLLYGGHQKEVYLWKGLGDSDNRKRGKKKTFAPNSWNNFHFWTSVLLQWKKQHDLLITQYSIMFLEVDAYSNFLPFLVLMSCIMWFSRQLSKNAQTFPNSLHTCMSVICTQLLKSASKEQWDHGPWHKGPWTLMLLGGNIILKIFFS